MTKFASAVGWLFLGGGLFSQTVTGTLEGRVTDSSGAVIAAAPVSAKNLDTGLTRSAKSNQDGYYQLTFLPVGPYTLTTDAPGFGKTRRPAQVELKRTPASASRLGHDAAQQLSGHFISFFAKQSQFRRRLI